MTFSAIPLVSNSSHIIGISTNLKSYPQPVDKKKCTKWDAVGWLFHRENPNIPLSHTYIGVCICAILYIGKSLAKKMWESAKVSLINTLLYI
jgi:hypothetical protein